MSPHPLAKNACSADCCYAERQTSRNEDLNSSGATDRAFWYFLQVLDRLGRNQRQYSNCKRDKMAILLRRGSHDLDFENNDKAFCASRSLVYKTPRSSPRYHSETNDRSSSHGLGGSQSYTFCKITQFPADTVPRRCRTAHCSKIMPRRGREVVSLTTIRRSGAAEP